MMKVAFARPDLTEAEFEAVRQTLQSGWITSGPQCDRFEEEFAEFTGSAHAVALNSATAALHLSLLACGIEKGDAVLVPSITFTATAEIVNRSGGCPLILDVDRDSYLLDEKVLRSFIEMQCTREDDRLLHKPSGRRIRAVIAVHYGGRPADVEKMQNICNRYNIVLLQDAAHCIPGSVNGRPVGAAGKAVAFSFYATKNMTTGEGGMLTTDDPAVASKARIMRLHGIETPAHRRSGWEYDVVSEGYKYNLSDIAAAIGRVQLRRAHEMHQKRKRIHEMYQSAFRSTAGIKLCPETVFESAHHLYTIEINAGPSYRDAFIQKINGMGIGTGLHFIPLYRLTYYKQKFALSPEDYPNSEAIFSRILSLPVYSAMSDSEIEYTIDCVKKAASETVPA